MLKTQEQIQISCFLCNYDLHLKKIMNCNCCSIKEVKHFGMSGYCKIIHISLATVTPLCVNITVVDVLPVTVLLSMFQSEHL